MVSVPHGVVEEEWPQKTQEPQKGSNLTFAVHEFLAAIQPLRIHTILEEPRAAWITGT